MKLLNFFVLGVLLLTGCYSKDEQKRLFDDVTEASGIDFRNDLHFTDRLNPYTYRNFYNGAGVAIGDINNDGNLDVFFAGNQVHNRLYLNQGNFKFSDITDKAGVASDSWSAGVTLVDINADGWLDIYVCKSGDPSSANRSNELFINNQDLTFTERASEYGLNITGLSVQASFFDYDRDGDLDCYLLTNSFKSIGAYDLVKNQREIPDSLGGNKFFLNDKGKFIDYTTEAGIYQSSIGFGLGITLGDFNDDNWIDIFVSNDFFERDYLYINDQQGAFQESLTDYFSSISMGSMGADFADLDNDGYSELFVTEMLPDSLHRRKSKTVFETWDKYQLNLRNGYYHQFSRNVLQKKIGRNRYAEIGRFAGVAASEWSWGALLFDMDNDGLRDIFIANGIYKDLLDRDYLTYTASDENIRMMLKNESNPIVKLIDQMPTSSFPNYAFRNTGNLFFENKAQSWGLGQPQFSSGSAYGDLDNDGDLDLVLNNINSPAAVYRNNSDMTVNKSVTFIPSSNGLDTRQIGTRVTVYANGKKFLGDNFVTRGFQSSVQPQITLGLGPDVKAIDSVEVAWPGGGFTTLRQIPFQEPIHLKKEEQVVGDRSHIFENEKLFSITLIDSTFFAHQSSGLNDFNRDRLLPMMYSNETPAIAVVDVQADAGSEFYIGGGKDQQGRFFGIADGKIEEKRPGRWKQTTLEEETRSIFFDVDQDGDQDYYLASGGRFYPRTSSVLTDRILLNDGKGNFEESVYPLPFTEFVSTGVVQSFDYDKDGDLDLFVGERFDPFVYGRRGRGYLFENDGKGRFSDVTTSKAPELKTIGMLTDAVVADVDSNGWPDLVVAGDWIAVSLLKNNQGAFSVSQELFGSKTGWWRCVESADLNGDQKPDFVIGNHGLNSFFQVGDRMYLGDFDGNGSTEQIFCTQQNGAYFPIADKDDFLSQLPSFKKKLLYYKDYSKMSIDELLEKSLLERASMYQVGELRSVMLLSKGAAYDIVPLPREAQFAPIYSLSISDFDGDTVPDIIAGGNHFDVKPQFGRQDASAGWFFKGHLADGQYTLLSGVDLNVPGEIRDIALVAQGQERYLIFTKHGSNAAVYKIDK